MDSRSISNKLIANSPQPQRYLSSTNPTNIIYSPSSNLIRSPIRSNFQPTSIPLNVNVRLLSPNVYQNTKITSPVQTIQLGNSQAFLSPNTMLALQSPFKQKTISLSDQELEQRYLKCVSRSKELLATYGYTMKDQPDYSKLDINKMYEHAVQRSQGTLVKYSEAIENKKLFAEEKTEIQPIFQFQFEERYLYDGELKEGLRNGYGTIRNDQGEEIYSGEWENDELCGKGKLKNVCSRVLEQEFDFKDFNKLAQCWVYYEGDFKRNLFDGMGDLLLSNGEKFVGKFERGVVHGEGSFYKSNGETELGLWENNILVKDL